MSPPTPPPQLPDEGTFQLSDEEIRRLQKILNDEGGYQYSEIEAKYRGLELLELFRMLVDPKADEERRARALSGPKMASPAPSPPPTPQPFPIRLDADHRYEMESNLRMLRYELGRVKTFPSSWRWAVVAAYNALGHALAMRHPVPPRDALHHLLELFDRVAERVPALREKRSAVEQLELLRTTWLQGSVTDWPGSRQELEKILESVATIARPLVNP